MTEEGNYYRIVAESDEDADRQIAKLMAEGVITPKINIIKHIIIDPITGDVDISGPH